jgi:hypothetical protein
VVTSGTVSPTALRAVKHFNWSGIVAPNHTSVAILTIPPSSGVVATPDAGFLALTEKELGGCRRIALLFVTSANSSRAVACLHCFPMPTTGDVHHSTVGTEYITWYEDEGASQPFQKRTSSGSFDGPCVARGAADPLSAHDGRPIDGGVLCLRLMADALLFGSKTYQPHTPADHRRPGVDVSKKERDTAGLTGIS